VYKSLLSEDVALMRLLDSMWNVNQDEYISVSELNSSIQMIRTNHHLEVERRKKLLKHVKKLILSRFDGRKKGKHTIRRLLRYVDKVSASSGDQQILNEMEQALLRENATLILDEIAKELLRVNDLASASSASLNNSPMDGSGPISSPVPAKAGQGDSIIGKLFCSCSPFSSPSSVNIADDAEIDFTNHSSVLEYSKAAKERKSSHYVDQESDGLFLTLQYLIQSWDKFTRNITSSPLIHSKCKAFTTLSLSFSLL
jgi:hypothetical protein